MCGICGFVYFDGSPASAEILRRMQAAILHRGPDSQGVHLEGTSGFCSGRASVGLASTRLKVIDLSESARQPLCNEDGRIWIVFNGEIYNYRELWEWLIARGHRFKSKSDTEVILHLYEERGEAAVADLDGMFAFALWDQRRGQLLLARDRTGKKPLFYSWDGTRIVFGSEIKTLLRHPDGADGVDEQAVRPYLIFGYVPGPQTFYRGVRQLPPGHTLRVGSEEGLCIRRYWDLDFAGEPSGGQNSTSGGKEAAERVRDLVTAAVRKRMIADVPLGAFLSGGLDSSIVVGLMSRLSSVPIRTFSIGFRGDPEYDESSHARNVARAFGTDHTECFLEDSPEDLLESLIWHYDGPFRDSSALPTFTLSRLARNQVTVVLNGDGGDELFAGYRRFQATLLAERIPRPVFRLCGRLLSGLPRARDRRAFFDRFARFVRSGSLPWYERFSEGFGAADLALDALLKRELLPGTGEAKQEPYFAPYLEGTRDCSLLGRLLYLNFKTYLADDLLVKADRCTMAHGLEARSPFLDRELIEYAARLPDCLKLSGRATKVILRTAFRDLVPRETMQRSKMGFGVPMARWLRSNLREALEEALLESRPQLGQYLNSACVHRLVREHLEERRDHSSMLWSLLTLERWLHCWPSWRNGPVSESVEPLPGSAGTDEIRGGV